MPKDQKKVRAINEKITDFVRKFFEKKGFVSPLPLPYPQSKKREKLTIFIVSKFPRASQTKSTRRHDNQHPAFTFTNLLRARTAQSPGKKRKKKRFLLAYLTCRFWDLNRFTDGRTDGRTGGGGGGGGG